MYYGPLTQNLTNSFSVFATRPPKRYIFAQTIVEKIGTCIVCLQSPQKTEVGIHLYQHNLLFF